MEEAIPITKPLFDGEEIKMLQKCLDSGWVTQGPMTDKFEDMFCKKQCCNYAVAVSSCTAALHIAMLSLGIKESDEVIVPAFTWVTSASCVDYVGAKVRFVDIERETMNLDPLKLEEAINSNTKAVVVVHLFGCSAKMDEIIAICRKHKLKVVEDCACAIGTKYKGKLVGTLGDIGCFSFHPRKAITTGEGGICSTNDRRLAEKIRQIRNHGVRVETTDAEYGKPYYMGVYDVLGYNLRLSDIQAAVGVAQLLKLEWLLQDRKRCADYYCEQLNGMNEIILPSFKEEFGHTYQSFVILLKNGNRQQRNYIMDKMKKNCIQSRPGTIAIHRTEYNKRKYGIKTEDYPNAVYCEDSSVTIPIYPQMDKNEQDYVIKVIKEAFNDLRK